MSKELWGDTHEDRELAKEEKKLDQYRDKFALLLSGYLGHPVRPDSLYMVKDSLQPYNHHVRVNHNLDDPIYINNIKENSFTFFKSIYITSSGQPFNYRYDDNEFTVYQQKALALLRTFYHDVDVIYMAHTFTKLNYENLLFKLMVKDLNIKNDNIRFSGLKAKINDMAKMPSMLYFDRIDYSENRSVNSLALAIDRYNEYIISKYSDLRLDIDMSLDEFKSTLEVIEMILFH